MAKHPDKFVDLAAADPRRPDCMELLRHAIEDLGLRGAKFGPIYNGVALADPRMAPVLDYLQKHNLPLTMHMGTFVRNAPVELVRAIHIEPVDGLLRINNRLERTRLPRVSDETIERNLASNALTTWGKGDRPEVMSR